MDIRTFVVTLIIGFLGTGLLGSWLNWPDAGAVLAAAFVGARIIWELQKKNADCETPEKPEE